MNLELRKQEDHISVWEKICVAILALCTVLQHYKGLFVNLSVTLLLLMFPYVLLKLLHIGKSSMRRLALVFPLMLSFAYQTVAHGTTVIEVGQAAVFVVYFAAIAAGCLNTKYFVRVITAVSKIACICIIVQYICYYVLGFHLQLVPTRLLSASSEQWVLLAQTGRVSVTGKATSFYRPSAFFLEPSHMFIYMFTPLLIILLSPDFDKRKLLTSALLTAGMVFSTSGMGIAVAAAAWLLFLAKHGGKDIKFDLRKLFRPMSALILLLLVVGGIALFIYVPFFRKSVARVLSSGDDYKNAVTGRIASSLAVLGDITGPTLLFGNGDSTAEIDVRLVSFVSEMYKYGIVGTLVSYLFYIQGLIKLKNQYFWICVVAIVLSFFSAHSLSSFFLLYCAFVFMEGFWEYSGIETKIKNINSNG